MLLYIMRKVVEQYFELLDSSSQCYNVPKVLEQSSDIAIHCTETCGTMLGAISGFEKALNSSS
jgi:hypothetical protein